MNKYHLLLGLCLLFLLQSPVVLALDCERVSNANYDLCIEILNSEISEEEKQLIIPNLDYDNSFFPDHEYVLDMNLDLDIESAPEGVAVKSGQFVELAWAKIFAIMPSVIYGEILYVPKKTSVFTGFDSRIKIPNNYYSSRYPRTSQGDCKRKYYLIEDDETNKIYVNNRYVGEGELTEIQISKDSEIKIIYKVYVRVKIKHYEWERYCKRWDIHGRCKKYDEDCEYDYTEYKNENIIFTDTIEVKLYENYLFAEVSPINIYGGATNFKMNYSDSVEISFKNSEYNFNKYIYSINYSNAPYYTSNLVAKDYNRERIINLFSGENTLAVGDATNCKIKAFDFFNILEKDCNDEYQNISFFIKTDKLKYDLGEEIQVNVFPNNISVKLSYGKNSKIAKKVTTFIAERYENRIIAEYNGLVAEKIIYITNKKRLMILWNLVVFALLNFIFYILFKKYHNKTK